VFTAPLGATSAYVGFWVYDYATGVSEPIEAVVGGFMYTAQFPTLPGATDLLYVQASSGLYLGLYTSPTNGLNYPVFGTSGSTLSFAWSSPNSNTFYCVLVQDSSAPASLTFNAAGAEYTVEQELAVNALVLNPTLTEVLNPLYEGNPVTATVTWSGGTGPFDVELYPATITEYYLITNPATTISLTIYGGLTATQKALYAPDYTCVTTATPVITLGSNPVTGVTGTSASFSFLAPNTAGTYYYCAAVTDQATGETAYTTVSDVPPEQATALTVATGLSGVGLALYATGPPLAPSGTDVGQTESATAVVTWSGGTAPYTITLYSGPSTTSCALDTTQVTSQSGVYPSTAAPYTASLVFTSPSATTGYCAKVSDASTPASVGAAGPVPWIDNPAIKVLLPQTYEIAAGTSTTLTATATGGTAPLFYQWFIGSSCAAADAVTAPSPFGTSYNTGVISTTNTYSVQVTDSSSGTPAASACATTTITVNNGPQGIAVAGTNPVTGLNSFTGLVYVANPSSYPYTSGNSVSVIDSDSNTVVNAIPLTITVGGYTWGVSPFGVAIDQEATYSYVYVTGTATWFCLTATPTSCITDAAFLGLSSTAQALYTAYAEGVVCTINMPTSTLLGCSETSGFVPTGIAVNEALGQAYVANNDANTVDVFALPIAPGSTPLTTINVGAGPLMVTVDPATYTVYVSDSSSNTVSVLQPRGGINFGVTTVPVGFEPVGIAINPLTNDVYVANSGSGTVSVLSGSSYQTLATIKTGGAPTGIDIDTASNTAYVADAANNVIIPISLATNTPGTPIPVGNAPFGVAFFLNPASPGLPNLVYVTNSGSNFVSVINPATGKVVATIVVP